MRVGSTLLLVLSMLVAPATTVLAQPGDDAPAPETNDDPLSAADGDGPLGSTPAGDDDGDGVVVVQETEDHIIAKIKLPTTVFSSEQSVRYKAPIGEAEASGGDNEPYTVELVITPETFQGGEVSLGSDTHRVEAFLEDHPDSPVPVIVEFANDTVRETLDELIERAQALEERTRDLHEQVNRTQEFTLEARETAAGQPVTNATLTVVQHRIDWAFQLLQQVDRDLQEIEEIADHAPVEEIVERMNLVDETFRLAYLALLDAQNRLSDHDPGDVSIGDDEELEQAVQEQIDNATDLANAYLDWWRDFVDWTITMEHYAFDTVRFGADTAFSTINGVIGGGEDDEDECSQASSEGSDDQADDGSGDECPKDDEPGYIEMAATLLNTLLDKAENNLTEQEERIVQRLDNLYPVTLDPGLPESPSYEHIRENMTNLSREAAPGETYDDYTARQINHTIASVRDVDRFIRWLVDDLLTDAPVGTLDPEATQDIRTLLNASHEQLNQSRILLQDTLSGSESEGDDQQAEGDDQQGQDDEAEEENSTVEQAWANANASQEMVREAVMDLNELAKSTHPVSEALAAAEQRVSQPTQVRVMIPKDASTPEGDQPGGELGDTDNLTDTVENETDELPGPDTPVEEPPTPSAPCPPGTTCPEEESSGSDEDGTGTDDQDSQTSDETDDQGSDDGADTNDGGSDGGTDDGSDGSDSGADGGDGGDGAEEPSDPPTPPGAPEVSVDPGELRVSEGEQTVTYVRIRNTGDAEQTFHMTVDKDAPVAVDAPGEAERTLGPGESGQIRARITPTGTGDGAVTFHVAGEDGSTAEQVPVSIGETPGGEPTLRVKVQPWNLRMSEEEGAVIDVSVENIGDSLRSVSLDPWTHGPAEASVDGPAEVEVSPGAEETLRVSVTPKATGPAEVTLRVTSSNGDALSPVALLSVVGPGALADGQPSDQGAENRPAEDGQEEERGLPLPAAAGLIALGLGALARRSRRD